MKLELGDEGVDGRDVDGLTAQWIGVVTRERVAAAATSSGLAGLYNSDALGRQKLALVASTTTLFPQSLFLVARALWSLSPRWIGRRRF
jgi:hypothetical protein